MAACRRSLARPADSSSLHRLQVAAIGAGYPAAAAVSILAEGRIYTQRLVHLPRFAQCAAKPYQCSFLKERVRRLNLFPVDLDSSCEPALLKLQILAVAERLRRRLHRGRHGQPVQKRRAGQMHQQSSVTGIPRQQARIGQQSGECLHCLVGGLFAALRDALRPQSAILFDEAESEPGYGGGWNAEHDCQNAD